MSELFKRDYERFCHERWSSLKGRIRIAKNHGLKFLYFFRKENSCRYKITKKYYSYRRWCQTKKYGLELATAKIGAGLVLQHPFNITINPAAVIGEDCTLFKGALIGSVRSGNRGGVPQIGDRVTICANAVVVGNIKIGNDVLIAANAFVNFDVPDNSLVLGNPGIIKYRENASKDYL